MAGIIAFASLSEMSHANYHVKPHIIVTGEPRHLNNLNQQVELPIELYPAALNDLLSVAKQSGAAGLVGMS
jgi:hypothetical protein